VNSKVVTRFGVAALLFGNRRGMTARGGAMKPFNSSRFYSTIYYVALFAGLVIPQMAQAQWEAIVGAQNHTKSRQAQGFFPNELWIHAGDTVSWTFDSDTDHTLTFLKTSPPPQVRPPAVVGCPGPTVDGSSFDGTACVNSGSLVKGKTYSVTFPTVGNYKLVCLVHANMTGVVHVLPLSDALPHHQGFYDEQAEDQVKDLLLHQDEDASRDADSSKLSVTAGSGEIVATGGGSSTLSVMRFMSHDIVIHAGQTVEWTNTDPVTAHTITFGPEPLNLIPPSSNVTLDEDLARHATINAPTDVVHSGFIVAQPQDRIGLVQSPLAPLGTVTRFRVTFTHAGVFPYICALHDGLGMKGQVTVLP